jgi:hypothetical protein
VHRESEGEKCFRIASSVPRAACCPAVGRPARSLDFDCEATTAALDLIVSSASLESARGWAPVPTPKTSSVNS